MRKFHHALVALLALPFSPAAAQDVVVIRRTIAPPRPMTSTPTPTPPALRWDVGAWTTPTATQCAQTVVRTRTVRCLDAADAVKSDATCSSVGTKPVTSESNVDYTACGQNYNCTPWVDDRQATGGPHNLLYNSVSPGDRTARRELAKRLCENHAASANINICTATMITEVGKPDVLRVFASVGTPIPQAPNSSIGPTTAIGESSTTACVRIK